MAWSPAHCIAQVRTVGDALVCDSLDSRSRAAGGASGAVYVRDEHYDTYTVPAGTFNDCWHVSVSGNTAVLCRDVGEVSFNSTNLLSKNFRRRVCWTVGVGVGKLGSFVSF